MIVDENSTKKILSNYGLQIPSGAVVRTIDDALNIAGTVEGPVVVKALIPAGGRGKAGGIQHCANERQLVESVKDLLGTNLLGHRVTTLRVETALNIFQELYAAIVVNTETATNNLMFSLAGGIEVESQSDSIKTMVVEPGADLPVHRIFSTIDDMDDLPVDRQKLSLALSTLYRAAADLDALLLEVNPLAVLDDGSLAVLDCKLQVDDNALYRHLDFRAMQQDRMGERELRATQLGVSFVSLAGDIGVITSGAGLGMATIDLLEMQGLKAANFLDTGGGISKEMVRQAIELIMEPSGVRGAIINFYGGINSMVEAAEGIVAATRSLSGNRPIVAKIQGNQQEEAWELLSGESTVHVVRDVQTERAVTLLSDSLA